MALERTKKPEGEKIEKPFKEEDYSQGSGEIVIDQGKKIPEPVEVNFMDEDMVSDFVKQPTPEAREQVDNSSRKTIQDVQREISASESNSKFELKDFEDISEFLIEIIDTGASTGLRFWSRDTSYAAYSIPKEKKKLLQRQLTLILVKYQTKFKIEFMFFLSLVLVYAVPFQKAYERRKYLKATGMLDSKKPVSVAESTNEVLEDEQTIRRKPGNPSKKKDPYPTETWPQGRNAIKGEKKETPVEEVTAIEVTPNKPLVRPLQTGLRRKPGPTGK